MLTMTEFRPPHASCGTQRYARYARDDPVAPRSESCQKYASQRPASSGSARFVKLLRTARGSLPEARSTLGLSALVGEECCMPARTADARCCIVSRLSRSEADGVLCLEWTCLP